MVFYCLFCFALELPKQASLSYNSSLIQPESAEVQFGVRDKTPDHKHKLRLLRPILGNSGRLRMSPDDSERLRATPDVSGRLRATPDVSG